MGELQRASIDQDMGLLRDLAAKLGIPKSGKSESLQDGAFWALELAESLTDKPDKTNEMRRNWFIRAGVPVHAPTTRAEGLPGRPAVVGAPRPTATVDPGLNLLDPKPKKGIVHT